MTDEQVRRLEERLDANAAALQGLAEKLDEVRAKDLPNLRVEVARDVSALKVTARIWGSVAGVVTGFVGSALVGFILAAIIR